MVEACVELDALPDRPHVKWAKVVLEAERRHGYGPRRTYDALLDLGRPWVRWMPIIDGHGNFGSPTHPPAEERYTECRLTPIGLLVAEAELDGGGALPLGLIEGTLYRGGSVAPSDPAAVLATVRAVADDPNAPDAAIGALLGTPVLPTGCDVECKDGALHLTARITVDGDCILLSNFPPGPATGTAMEMIAARARRLPIASIDDASSGDVAHGDLRLEIGLRPGADPSAVVSELRDIWGVHVVVRGQPMDLTALRSWVSRHWNDETEAAVDRLASLVVA